MARASIRLHAAACVVVAVLAVVATAARVVHHTADACGTHLASDPFNQALAAFGHDSQPHHRLIRHGRGGSRQSSPVHSGTVPTARLDARASQINARRARVPARRLLVNLIAPRAPASIFS